MVQAAVTFNDDREEQMAFRSYIEFISWLEHHYGEYKGFKSDLVAAHDLRQGKGGKLDGAYTEG